MIRGMVGIVLLIVASLVLWGWLQKSAENRMNKDVERVTDCYAQVLESSSSVTTSDLADAMRAYGRCH